MKDKKKITELRKQINYKFERITRLQEEMVSLKKMIAASLIKRYLGTKERKRTSHAFYLSILRNGKTKLEYVAKGKEELVKTQVMEWKRYQQGLKRWRELTEYIGQDLKELGKIQGQLEQE